MKKSLATGAIPLLAAMQVGYAQGQQWICQTVDTSSSLLSKVTQTDSSNQPLIIILVDFPDGRKADGSLPTVDSDTSLVSNIDACGSMGYIFDLQLNAYRKTIRKYVYEDYWNMVYSIGTYTGQSHPDYASHQGYIPPGAGEVAYDRFWPCVCPWHIVRPFSSRQYPKTVS